MGIIRGVKNMIDGFKGKIEEKQEENSKAKADQEKLESWKKKLNEAMSKHDVFRANCSAWDALYNGTKEVDTVSSQYVSDKVVGKTKQARQVVNLVFQLIESQIDTSIPQPRVDAMEEEDKDKTDMVEGQLTYMTQGTEMERVNSENERIVKKNSLAVFKVNYNPDFKAHSFRGRIETTNPHPANVIPQPGVYKVADMDYIFQIETRTLDYVCRKYGEEFREVLEEEAAEFGYLENFSENISQTGEKGQLSIVEAWYKDKEGDIGKLTWCNETILDDKPKFFYKRDESGNIIETEQLEIESVDQLTGQPTTEVIEVECHAPKRFPFVIQYNIPKEKSFYGLSDPFIVRDQQEGIKKMLSMQEEKLIMGTTKIITRKGSGIKDKLTNAISQILETDDPTADIKVVDLKTPDNSLTEQYQIYTQAAKDALGVTEASQGRAESSTLSGKALEQLASYSQGRQSVKIFEKQLAYKELYNLYYDFLLAFYDDKIPYKIQGTDNQPQYGYFDKAKLAKQDITGTYYFPEFDIYITADQGIPKDKTFIMQSAQEILSAGAIDAVEYWMIMENIGYPNASAILDMEKQKQQQAMQLQQMQQDMQMQQQSLGLEQQKQQMSMDEQNQDMNMQKTAQDMTGKGMEMKQQGEDQALMNILKNLPPELQEALLNMPPEEQKEILDKFNNSK